MLTAIGSFLPRSLLHPRCSLPRLTWTPVQLCHKQYKSTRHPRAVISHYASEHLVCVKQSSLLPASRTGKFRYHRFARHVANALQKVINNTSLLDYCSSTGTMKLITTAILLFASSTLAVSVKVIRHGPLQPIPASSANAMLQVRCVKQECQCTGWDVNSCSGPGCGQQCNTGG